LLFFLVFFQKCLRWIVRAKDGSVVNVVGCSRFGAGVVCQVNSEGYIVVSRSSSVACRWRLSCMVLICLVRED
jgi:hypothetical protein